MEVKHLLSASVSKRVVWCEGNTDFTRNLINQKMSLNGICLCSFHAQRNFVIESFLSGVHLSSSAKTA